MSGTGWLWIAAFEEPPDDMLLDAAPKPAARPQLGCMPCGALMQRRRARLARPVHPARGRLRRMQALVSNSAWSIMRRHDRLVESAKAFRACEASQH
jgi:hypothetical protein